MPYTEVTTERNTMNDNPEWLRELQEDNLAHTRDIRSLRENIERQAEEIKVLQRQVQTLMSMNSAQY
jgi:predicted RNase H-like nuclease (RuvC/YqgF family)